MSGAYGDRFLNIRRRFLFIWLGVDAHLYEECRCGGLWYGYYAVHHCDIFLMWDYGSVSGSTQGNGTFCGANDSFCGWNGWNENSMDILGISAAQSIGFSVYFISGVMDLNDRDAGDLFLLCPKKSTWKGKAYSMTKLTKEEKHKQCLKEIKATVFVVFICFLWHVLTAFLLNPTGWTIFHMPAWFVVSVVGTVLLAMIGVFWLLKFVFIDLDYDEEENDNE